MSGDDVTTEERLSDRIRELGQERDAARAEAEKLSGMLDEMRRERDELRAGLKSEERECARLLDVAHVATREREQLRAEANKWRKVADANTRLRQDMMRERDEARAAAQCATLDDSEQAELERLRKVAEAGWKRIKELEAQLANSSLIGMSVSKPPARHASVAELEQRVQQEQERAVRAELALVRLDDLEQRVTWLEWRASP